MSGLDIATLYEQHAAELRRFAERHAMSPEEAEDLVHDVFVKALKASYCEQGQARAWLYRILYCRIIDRVRSDRRRPTVPYTQSLDTRRAEPPDNQVAAALMCSDLLQMVHLRPNQAVAFRMLMLEHRTAAEVAAHMGMSVPAAKALRDRAVRLFRKVARELEREERSYPASEYKHSSRAMNCEQYIT